MAKKKMHWLYNNPICTGLGDRLGLILALSALASMHNSSCVVHMEWCTRPERALVGNPQFLKWTPKWTGFDYPLATLQATLSIPANIRLFLTDEPPKRWDGLVYSSGPVPAWEGSPQTSTLYCKALSMQPENRETRSCERAYKAAGAQVKVRDKKNATGPFVLVHFRSPDDNTCTAFRDEIPFCTPAVLQELHAAGVYMKVISNNHSFSMQWLRGLPSLHLVHSSSAFQDMALALNAVAIVQHASTGWSSYTSVPAMAKGIPLINTFSGRGHRFEVFASYGEVPREFHACHQTAAFVRKAVRRYNRVGRA